MSGVLREQGEPAPRGAARKEPSPRERYSALLRELEEALPSAAGVAARQACDWNGIEVKFGFDETQTRMHITAVVGKLEAANEQKALQEILAMQLSTSTPASWTPGWDRESGRVVVITHVFLRAEVTEPLIVLASQLDVCVQMARLLQQTHMRPSSAGTRTDNVKAPPRPPSSSVALLLGRKGGRVN